MRLRLERIRSVVCAESAGTVTAGAGSRRAGPGPPPKAKPLHPSPRPQDSALLRRGGLALLPRDYASALAAPPRPLPELRALVDVPRPDLSDPEAGFLRVSFCALCQLLSWCPRARVCSAVCAWCPPGPPRPTPRGGLLPQPTHPPRPRPNSHPAPQAAAAWDELVAELMVCVAGLARYLIDSYPPDLPPAPWL